MTIPATKNNTSLFLFAIVILALALRIYKLDFQSLWIDEIVSMVEADPVFSLNQVIKNSAGDQPPAFFIGLNGWLKIFSFSDISGRLFSVLIGIGGVISMFFLGKEVKDEQAGLLASLITSINYIHILLSQEVRFYTTLFLFTTLSFLFFIRSIKRLSIPDFLLYTVFAIVVLYSHYYGLVVIATQGVIFLGIILFYPVTKKFVILSVSSGILILAAFSPWLPIIFSDFQTPSFWIKSEPFYFPAVYFYAYFKDFIAAIIFAGIILVYLSDVIKGYLQNKRIDVTDFVIIGWIVLSYLIPITYSIVRIPMLHVRYTIISLPCIILMISLGLLFLKAKLRFGLLAISSVSILVSLFFITDYYNEPRKEDWRGMISSVISKAQPGDIVISQSDSYCNYYFKSRNSPIRAILPESFRLDDSNKNIWVLDGFDVPQQPIPVELELLRNGYQVRETDNFLRTRAILYSRSRE